MAQNLPNGDHSTGAPIPALTDHAVSVSLPTWDACVGYEEGRDSVIQRMQTGYPRFFVHLSIQQLSKNVVQKYAKPDEDAMLFPSLNVAQRCAAFVVRNNTSHVPPNAIYVLELTATEVTPQTALKADILLPAFWAVIFPVHQFPVAKQFWQHSGDGVSSRRAEYCQSFLTAGLLTCSHVSKPVDEHARKGPRRYRSKSAAENAAPQESDSNGGIPTDGEDFRHFVEERYGRNLNISLVSDVKTVIKKRIAGSLAPMEDSRGKLEASTNGDDQVINRGFSEEDVYLYPTGMSAIFNTHRLLLATLGSKKSICYGFPYIDTLKILEKFGPGCIFYGYGSESELDELEQRLQGGEKLLALFCEFPGNPLLATPNLIRIRKLADRYEFLVVIDETIGNFLNVNVMPHADVLVSSLTKLFSGDCNVMGGCAILNPRAKHYAKVKAEWDRDYEDNYWAEDAIFLERNSRNFASRADKINQNAERICDLLLSHPRVKDVFYPKHVATRSNYDACRTEKGGYGGLLSVTFHAGPDAIKFYDSIEVDKGPSLGTNFTLSCPYVILAHFTELPWAATYGVDPNLVRFSVGLEETEDLVKKFQLALSTLNAS